MSEVETGAPAARPSNPILTAALRAQLGRELRALYGDPAEERLPLGLRRLADRVAQVIRANTEPVDQAFIDEMMGSLKTLRAHTVSLSRDVHRAEDLVQETVLRAISKQEAFQAGTNLQAWLMIILRNLFLSGRRRMQHEVEDADGIHAAAMVLIPEQEDGIMVRALQAALARLPRVQRDAIMLVGAEGMSYEEVAAALGVKVGTLKSRVNGPATGYPN